MCTKFNVILHSGFPIELVDWNERRKKNVSRCEQNGMKPFHVEHFSKRENEKKKSV